MVHSILDFFIAIGINFNSFSTVVIRSFQFSQDSGGFQMVSLVKLSEVTEVIKHSLC